MLTAVRWKCRRYMESSDEECQQKYIQVGVNQQSFHLINVFTLKTYNNRYTHIKLLAAEYRYGWYHTGCRRPPPVVYHTSHWLQLIIIIIITIYY